MHPVLGPTQLLRTCGGKSGAGLVDCWLQRLFNEQREISHSSGRLQRLAFHCLVVAGTFASYMECTNRSYVSTSQALATVDYEFISTKQVFAVCPYGLATDVSSLDPAQVLHGLEDLEGSGRSISQYQSLEGRGCTVQRARTPEWGTKVGKTEQDPARHEGVHG